MSTFTPSLVMDVTETRHTLGEVGMNSLMATLISQRLHATWTTSDPDVLHDEEGVLHFDHHTGDLHVNGHPVYTWTRRDDQTTAGTPAPCNPCLTIY